jgi:hypothetical protein
MVLLELRYLGIRPAMITVALGAERFHVAGRVIGSNAEVDGMGHHRAQNLSEAIGGLGLVARAAMSLRMCSRCNIAAGLSPYELPSLSAASQNRLMMFLYVA